MPSGAASWGSTSALQPSLVRYTVGGLKTDAVSGCLRVIPAAAEAPATSMSRTAVSPTAMRPLSAAMSLPQLPLGSGLATPPPLPVRGVQQRPATLGTEKLAAAIASESLIAGHTALETPLALALHDIGVYDGHCEAHTSGGAMLGSAGFEEHMSVKVRTCTDPDVGVEACAIADLDPEEDSIDVLRTEIGELRGGLDSLRGLLNEGLQQRDAAERLQGATAARLQSVQQRKAFAEKELEEAQGEAQRLRAELAQRPIVVCSEEQSNIPEENVDGAAMQELRALENGGYQSGTTTPELQRSMVTQAVTVATSSDLVSGATSSHHDATSSHHAAAPQAHLARSSSYRAQLVPAPQPQARSPSPRSSASGGGAAPRRSGAVGLERTDNIDEMWCAVLRRFPLCPHWSLVKEKRGVYRMGGVPGKRILCQVSHGGLQVRVGGGWMGAVPFLEKFGPSVMGLGPRQERPQNVAASMDMPASMERLLVPTKCWAERIGINKVPDLREHRRHVVGQHDDSEEELALPADTPT